MAIEGLGYRFNFVPIASGTLISVKDSAGITFVMTGADTYTLATAATYNGSTTNCAQITDYFTCTSTSGGAKWVSQTQAASATLTVSGATAAAFYVDAAGMPANALYMSLTAGASGLVYAILDGLLVQRGPASLRQLSGSAS